MRRRLVGMLIAVAAILAVAVGVASAVDAGPPLATRTRLQVQADGRIIYVAKGQIWEWADGATRALTKPGVRYEGAAWSLDGQTIAASEMGENHSDLVLLDTSGREIRQLTQHWSHVSVRQSAWARKPTFRPGQDQLAFVSDLGQTDMSLWLVSPRGGGARREWNMQLGSGGLDWPSFSPDGKKVAVASYPAGLFKPPQVFVADLVTGGLVQLTDLKDGAMDPAWSPDGATIAFAGRADGKTRIMTIGATGTGLVRLTDGKADRAPAWSPTGEEVAFLSLDGTEFDLAAVRVSIQGVSEPRRLTRGQQADAVSGVSWAR